MIKRPMDFQTSGLKLDFLLTLHFTLRTDNRLTGSSTDISDERGDNAMRRRKSSEMINIAIDTNPKRKNNNAANTCGQKHGTTNDDINICRQTQKDRKMGRNWEMRTDTRKVP